MRSIQARGWRVLATLLLTVAASAADSTAAAAPGSGSATAATTPAAVTPPPPTGILQLHFTEQHPETSYARLRARHARLPPVPEPGIRYDITKEPFDANVPASYDGTVPYGLIVHIDSGKTGNPYVYKDLMGPHHLIWVGSAASDNDRPGIVRCCLALDAVWNMTHRYRIDPKRIFICGLSGGGRCASMTAVTYADVFTGGAIYMVGCNRFELPDEHQLGISLLKPAQEHAFVFCTGSNDFNHEDTLGVLAFYQSSGFTHCTLLDTPGMGHEFPPPPVFDHALHLLDEPLTAQAQALVEEGRALVAHHHLVDACAAFQTAISGYPMAADVIAAARPLLEKTRAEANQQLTVEYQRLANASTPSAERIRAFAVSYAAFPIGETAHARADALAQPVLDQIIKAAGASEANKLGRFLAQWQGFPVAERARVEYDRLASVAAAAIEALTDHERRDKARLRFLGQWTTCPTVATMRTALEHDLDARVTMILSVDDLNARAQQLQRFAHQWKATAAAERAQAAYDALVAQAQAQAAAGK